MHIDIHLDRTNADNNRVILDGQDLTSRVLADGFRVELNEARQPVVTMRLKPDTLLVNGNLYVTEAPPGEVCKCGHMKDLHSGDRAQDFGCNVEGCYVGGTCCGWDPKERQ
jgi:hypothetical protein